MSHLHTFLFTDLENSTSLWEKFPDEMHGALAKHDALMKQAVENNQGRIVKTMGDGLHAVFESPADGVAGALSAQQAIAAESWPAATGPLKVRIGLHTGESQAREGDFYGTTVNLAARVMGLGHGGQVLISDVTASLVLKSLPTGCFLSDLGEHRLRGISSTVQIHQLCHPDLIAEFPVLKSLATFKHNLHRQLSSFIGREKELADIKRFLSDTQLLTLLGPGGTGKTRLMLQVAEEVIEDYPDGVWLVELAPLTDPDLIAERVAAALNIQEQPGRKLFDTLADYLRQKELLLLLDNVEHIVRESAIFTEHLLEHCPKLTILVTGREALFIDGEHTLQIPSLSLPDDDQEIEAIEKCEAVQLFLERARAIRSDFTLRKDNAQSLVEIVRRLDGIPLALELAAARLRMLTIEKIAERLNDRFRLLTGGRRTALPRQQTLQALIDWSWQLLDKKERILLRRLSVFSGGWSLEAAEKICGFEPLDDLDVFDQLDQLINKSLVTVDYLDGVPRYGMLESIRQFSQDKLFEAKEGETLRDRHAEYFVAFTVAADEELYKKDMMDWVKQLRLDLDNLRAVMTWTLDERPELALRLTGHLRHNQGYWMSSTEVDMWLSGVIDRTRPFFESEDALIPSADFIKALTAYAYNFTTLGQHEEMKQFADEAVNLARLRHEDRLWTYAVSIKGMGIIGTGRTEQNTEGFLEEIRKAIQISRQNNWQLELAQNTATLGALLFFAGKLDEGQQFIDETFQLRKEMGSPRDIAFVMENKGVLAAFLGDWESSLEFTLGAIELQEQLGARMGVMMNRSRLAHIYRYSGEYEAAEEIYRETILGWQEHNSIPAVVHQLECFAYLAIVKENHGRAAQLLGKAKASRENLNAQSFDPREIRDLKQAMEQILESMGEDERDRLMTEGAKMSLDEAVELAMRKSS